MPTISSKIQELIAEQIISGEIAPGTRLDERALAERFEVSRTPIREALRQLAARGLTQVLPMRGAVVIQISVKELTELLHTNCELEALCARLSAESMTAMEKTELEFVHQRAKDFVAAGDTDGYLEANRDFHRLILEGSHNATLSRLVGEIRDRLSPYRQYHPDESDRLMTSHAAHDAIVAAILEGRGEQAYLSMRSHNAHLGSAALRAVKQAQALPAGGSKPSVAVPDAPERPASMPRKGATKKSTTPRKALKTA